MYRPSHASGTDSGRNSSKVSPRCLPSDYDAVGVANCVEDGVVGGSYDGSSRDDVPGKRKL